MSHKTGIVNSLKNISRNRVSSEKLKSMVKTGSITPEADFIEEITTLLKPGHMPYYAIIYKVNQVLLKKIVNINMSEDITKHLDPNYLKEVRIFSEKSELLIWRKGDLFKYRFREDNIGDEEAWIYEEYHVVWGTKLENPSHLVEEFRGIELTLPFNILDDVDLPLRYLVRNYFHIEDETIRFYDARLVKFRTEKGGI